MRQAPWRLLASALALPLIACTTTDRAPTDPQSVYETIVAQRRPALERFYQGDPSGYRELFADELTYFDPRSGGRLDGISALRDYYAPLEGQINVPRYEVLNSKIQLHGDIGVFTSTLNEYASEGPASVRWNSTEVYRRIGEEWRIIHAHWSVIGDT